MKIIEEVAIEYLDNDLITVTEVDSYFKIVIDSPLEVTTKKSAFEKYNIVGEIYNGLLKLYKYNMKYVIKEDILNSISEKDNIEEILN